VEFPIRGPALQRFVRQLVSFFTRLSYQLVNSEVQYMFHFVFARAKRKNKDTTWMKDRTKTRQDYLLELLKSLFARSTVLEPKYQAYQCVIDDCKSRLLSSTQDCTNYRDELAEISFTQRSTSQCQY
jgi:hypothetical protein